MFHGISMLENCMMSIEDRDIDISQHVVKSLDEFWR